MPRYDITIVDCPAAVLLDHRLLVGVELAA